MESIKGYVDHFIYQNSSNGYGVMVLLIEGEEITCVGSFQGVEPGECLVITGGYVEHALYGRQFKASSFRVVPPEGAAAVERYLGSGAIRGIGPVLASKIVKRFGEDTFEIVEREPERLAEIKGISERMAREIAVQMEDKRDMREAFVYLQQYGISNNLAVKIYEAYGSKVYSVMQENPFKLAEDIAGIGFKIADEIAEKIGIHTDSDYRIQSGILYTLLQAAVDGNTYLPQEELLAKAADMLGLAIEQIAPVLPNLVMDKKVVIKDEAVYAVSFYYEELNCARMLLDRNVSMGQDGGLLPSEETRILSRIKQMEEALGLELDELQERAVLESVKGGILILSGGPGTGKTTTINMMIRFFESEGLDILLAAPTGRAAKRMTEATGYEARTIHRLLELNGGFEEERQRVQFERNEENPLEADVIIVDEMSMVDIHLFQALLKAVAVGTRLILVGDVNQLPSVGPGRILKDIIESEVFPVVMLQKIFRQAEESDIVVNAHKIREGKMLPLDNKSKDFFFLERDNVNVIYKHMVQLITEKMPRYVGAEPFDIQVLTPMRKGFLGVETLNEILQEYLNPPAKEKTEYLHGSTLFRLGDKVMQIRNNYQAEWEIVSKYGIPVDKGLGVFNGDMGIVADISEAAKTVTVEYDEHKRVTYPFTSLDELELAYAITIHKSQGSEYPAIILPILSGPQMLLHRNLLYTGITRAKSCVTILGSREVLQSMIQNQREQKRYSGLKERICQLWQQDLSMGML